MLAITNATNAASTATSDYSNNCPAMETLAEESPSHKKQYPEFSKPFSDNNSVTSGDDTKGWMREEEVTMATISAHSAAKEKEADELEDIVDDVQESEMPMLRQTQLLTSKDTFLFSSLGDFRMS